MAIERTFNLGDYKSLKVTLDEVDGDEERILTIIEDILDTYLTFFLHQKLDAEIYGRDTSEWDAYITEVDKLKEYYLNTGE